MIEMGVHIEAVYQDPDVIEVVVTARNRDFSGASSFYTGELELRGAAATLKGFPVDVADRREIRIGEGVWQDRADGVSFTFSCRDGLGHVAADVKVTADDRSTRIRQSVILVMLTEAAAIDNFVQDLVVMAETRRGAAFLRSGG